MVNQIDNDTTKQVIGSNIRALRDKSGLTAVGICEELDMNRSYYYTIEAGTANVTIEVLQKIAHFFEVNVAELMIEKKNGRRSA